MSTSPLDAPTTHDPTADAGVPFDAGVFNVIGHRTAVNQMVMGRAPFGMKGSVIPGLVQFALTMGLVSLAAGLVAGWAWQYGLVPAMQGPLAKALGNTDFSWLSGSLVAGGLYFLLTRREARA